jgi:hypothetical protein
MTFPESRAEFAGVELQDKKQDKTNSVNTCVFISQSFSGMFKQSGGTGHKGGKGHHRY